VGLRDAQAHALEPGLGAVGAFVATLSSRKGWDGEQYGRGRREEKFAHLGLPVVVPG
jgi:hypothetical protein